MCKQYQGGKEHLRITVLCGNVDNTSISSDLKITPLSLGDAISDDVKIQIP